MSRRLVWVGCGKPATVRIEVYSPAGGLAHGSLDASAYTCEQHANPAASAVYATGLTPYRASAPMYMDRTCGHIYRYPTATATGSAR